MYCYSRNEKGEENKYLLAGQGEEEGGCSELVIKQECKERKLILRLVLFLSLSSRLMSIKRKDSDGSKALFMLLTALKRK